MDLDVISQQVKQAVTELFSTGTVKDGQILVVGCSTSEISGKRIGRSSNTDVGEIVARSIIDALPESVYLAAQCCEHLNRALVVEEEAAEKFGWEVVSVIPMPCAGGAFAASVRALLKKPVVVENVKAHWGLDIGDTLIGMHMKSVVVPVRLAIKEVGQAHLTAARYRPKLIGGARAVYE